MREVKLPRIVLHHRAKGTRPAGRPRTRWIDKISKVLLWERKTSTRILRKMVIMMG